MKPFAIEARIHYIRNGKGKAEKDTWFIYNKYKTIKSMLQGLTDIRKNENISSWETPTNGEMVIWKFIWQYRPVHSNLI